MFFSQKLPQLYYVIMNLTHSCVDSSLSWSLGLIIYNTSEALCIITFFVAVRYQKIGPYFPE